MSRPKKSRKVSGVLVADPLDPVLPKKAKSTTNNPKKIHRTGFWKKTSCICAASVVGVLTRYPIALSVDLTRLVRSSDMLVSSADSKRV